MICPLDAHTHARRSVPGSKKRKKVQHKTETSRQHFEGGAGTLKPVDIVEGDGYGEKKKGGGGAGGLMRREQRNSGYSAGRRWTIHQERNMGSML
jgi:hypothetical protein